MVSAVRAGMAVASSETSRIAPLRPPGFKFRWMRAVHRSGVSSSVIATAVFMAEAARDDGTESRKSQAVLGGLTNKGRDQVGDDQKALESAAWIVHYRNERRTKVYRLDIPDGDQPGDSPALNVGSGPHLNVGSGRGQMRGVASIQLRGVARTTNPVQPLNQPIQPDTGPGAGSEPDANSARAPAGATVTASESGTGPVAQAHADVWDQVEATPREASGPEIVPFVPTELDDGGGDDPEYVEINEELVESEQRKHGRFSSVPEASPNRLRQRGPA